ncbi:MAG TPA: hypothetical protein VN538_09010 [Clostridia bacterium]|nr:hypothetical protein [Clostridia bacterium]
MSQLGHYIGILTAITFSLAIMNFVIKFVNRKWVVKLPKESKFKAEYIKVMKFLVKNHRFFAFAAVALMVAHIILQVTYKWVSITGIVTASLAVITAILGGIMFKAKKRTPAMLWAHRGAVIALILAFLVHAITMI